MSFPLALYFPSLALSSAQVCERTHASPGDQRLCSRTRVLRGKSRLESQKIFRSIAQDVLHDTVRGDGVVQAAVVRQADRRRDRQRGSGDKVSQQLLQA